MTEGREDARPWYSATQLETFGLCARKWGLRYIDKIPGKQHAAAELGVAIHAQLEGWLREGRAIQTDTPAGAIAMAGLHYLPAPKSEGLEVETQFGLELGGHRFLGYKDAQILSRIPPIVIDHKTTADFKWAKTPEELRDNYQACLYAADAMHKAGAAECDLAFVYYKTRGRPESKLVLLRVSRDDVTPTLERAIRLAAEMAAAREAGCKGKELPVNPAACGAFGGCDYAGAVCGMTHEEKFTVMSNSTMSDFLSRIQARKGAVGINPPEAALPPPPPVEAPPPPPAAAAPILDPSGKFQLVEGQWVPFAPAPPPPPAPMAAPAPAPPVEAPAAAPPPPAAEEPKAKRTRRAATPVATADPATVAEWTRRAAAAIDGPDFDAAPLVSMFDQMGSAFAKLSEACRSGAEFFRGFSR